VVCGPFSALPLEDKSFLLTKISRPRFFFLLLNFVKESLEAQLRTAKEESSVNKVRVKELLGELKRRNEKDAKKNVAEEGELAKAR
jgi:hypothetical protein